MPGAGTPTQAQRLHGLPPIVSGDARVLVLGSFPSAASLASRQYYAHPQNCFWLITGTIFEGSDWRLLHYGERVRRISAAGVAIWDSYGECERAGSLDAAIRDPRFNDFAALLAAAPKIARVCFNGATAARAVRHVASFGLETVTLPSTSPANAAQDMTMKLARWRDALTQP